MTSMASVQEFYGYLKEKKFAEASNMMEKDQKILWKIGYSYIVCGGDGAYGMPLWKHFGKLLQDEENYANSKLEETKNFARDLCQCETSQYNDSKSLYLGMLCNFALAANWPDIAKECIGEGMDIKEKEAFQVNGKIRGAEMISIFNDWTETHIKI